MISKEKIDGLRTGYRSRNLWCHERNVFWHWWHFAHDITMLHNFTQMFIVKIQEFCDHLHFLLNFSSIVGMFYSSKKATKHTYQLRGMANTVLMRTTTSPRQWQPWTVVSPFLGLIRSHLHTHAVGELFFSSQPTATTCVVWSWRLMGCLCIRLGSKKERLWSVNETVLAMPCWWTPRRAKQLCMTWLPLSGWYGCAHAYGIGHTTELVRVLQSLLSYVLLLLCKWISLTCALIP